MTGNGPGGTLPVIKSEGNLAASARSSSPGNTSSSTGDLSRLEEGSVADSSSSEGQPQGQEASMTASGFVHAEGEHVSHSHHLASKQ
jgi:hypothetical protein